jgi:hypothetical protein
MTENEIQQALIDAARYRWLRDCGLMELPYVDYGIGRVFPEGDNLDAIVDELRSREATEGDNHE